MRKRGEEREEGRTRERFTMINHGYPWFTMVIHRYSIPMVHNGHPWISIVNQGYHGLP